MYGAILGDIIGEPYEFEQGPRSKDFPLFCESPVFTDDSLMTIAICQGILEAGVDAGEDKMKKSMIASMRRWGERHPYPAGGYGGGFARWLRSKNPEPYNSWGNGSAMRVAATGWLFDTLERTRQVARWSAEVTHNHPEGIKGAESVASVIWMARNGSPKDKIKSFVESEFNYDLSRTCDQIRPTYEFDPSCQGTVPEAITAAHCGMNVLGFTLCTNMAAGVLDQPLSGEEVIAAGQAAGPKFTALVKACLEQV